MITRRHAIKTLGTASLVFAAAKLPPSSAQAPAPAPPSGPFKLEPLPYSADALEPFIDARTMEIHHDRHHATYVANLNKAVIDQPKLASQSVEAILRDLADVPPSVKTAVQNHGGGHYNHTLFWELLKKDAGEPKGDLAMAINGKFGSYKGFQEQFTKASLGVFGSGWAWLCLDKEKQLLIETTPNQDSPVSKGRNVLLGIDVWEHAYYLKYQNKRADYVAAFYNVINWDFVAARMDQFVKKP